MSTDTQTTDPAASRGGASDRITREVLTWPGTHAETGGRGEWSFRLGRREIGHLHGDTVAHLFFPKTLWRELFAEGRITHHPVFPDREGPSARAVTGDDDIADVLAMLRTNYDRSQTAD